MSRTPLLLALSWLLTCVAVVVGALSVRLAPVELAMAWPSFSPLPAAVGFSGPVALVLAALAVLSLFIFSGFAREKGKAKPFAELLLFYPFLFAYVWFLLPAGAPAWRDFLAGGIFSLAAIYLIRTSDGPIIGPRWIPGRNSRLGDAALVLLPVALGYALGHHPDLKAGGISFVLYPVYALVQLYLFLYLPVTRLRTMGLSPANSALLAALVFALIHWPNPLVMLVTAGCMLVWAHQFQNGRPLWQLALVMGLCATTFSQFLPDELTRHLRVGPGYVRNEALVELADFPQRDSADYLTRIYPLTMEREITPEELETWVDLLNEARPSTRVFIFLSSSECRNRAIREGLEVPPPPEIHWVRWPEPWKKKIAHYAGDDYFRENGSTTEGFLRGLYRDILGRGASAEELATWTSHISRDQKKRLGEILLEHRLLKGQAIFEGMSVEELRLQN